MLRAACTRYRDKQSSACLYQWSYQEEHLASKLLPRQPTKSRQLYTNQVSRRAGHWRLLAQGAEGRAPTHSFENSIRLPSMNKAWVCDKVGLSRLLKVDGLRAPARGVQDRKGFSCKRAVNTSPAQLICDRRSPATSQPRPRQIASQSTEHQNKEAATMGAVDKEVGESTEVLEQLLSHWHPPPGRSRLGAQQHRRAPGTL